MSGVKVVSARHVRSSRQSPRPLRLLLLLLTLWPIVYMGIFLAVWFRLFFAIMGPSPATEVSTAFPIALFVGHLVTMLISLALMVTYIVHLFRNDRVDGNMKAVWAIVLFMGGMVAMPVYWYLYLWREAPATP